MSDTELLYNWKGALKLIERKLEEYEAKQPTPKILFVDDDAADIDLFSRMLSKFKQETTYCTNAEEARRLLSTGKWDFVFMDYRMPQQSGLDLLKAADFIRPDTQCYVITGYPESKVAEEVYRLARVFVPKDAVTPHFLGTILRAKNE